MSEKVFKKGHIKISPYPTDFIPNGSKLIIGLDEASPNGDSNCCVKGFYKDGKYHVQKIEMNNEQSE